MDITLGQTANAIGLFFRFPESKTGDEIYLQITDTRLHRKRVEIDAGRTREETRK